MVEKEYPISEIFVAPQGEGAHAGRLMTFVRLAGCTVGTRYSKDMYVGKTSGEIYQPPVFPIYTNECHIFDGRTMACDTDYRKKESLTKEQIEERINELGNVKTVCISGGEPLMHNILTLVKFLKLRCNRRVHLETSGTIAFTLRIETILEEANHVAVSPKLGFLDAYCGYADELKILVDEHFDWNKLPQSIRNTPYKIYLQPVNAEHEINMENVKRCLAIQLKHPKVLLSLQLHKVWQTR